MLIDSVQNGKVVHVGMLSASNENSISKQSNGVISVCPGGVVGDYHFQYEVQLRPSTDRVKAFDYPDLHSKVLVQGGKLIQTHQISLFEIEEIDRINWYLSKFSKSNIAPGMVGENITTQDIRLNEIRLDSIITINNVRLKVKARRNFCERMFTDFPAEPFFLIKNNKNELGELRVGVICQVLDVGDISAGDVIQVVPNADLIGSDWKNLPVSWKRKPSIGRVEHIP